MQAAQGLKGRAAMAGLAALSLVLGHAALRAQQAPAEGGRATRDLLYVGAPGTDDHLNGTGVLVFDVRNHYRFVKRIPTWDFVASRGPESVKGIAASPATGYLYISTLTRIGAIDLSTDKMVWSGTPGGACCDRMAVSPDGTMIYAPAAGSPAARRLWYALDARTGELLKTIDVGEPVSPHNTIFSLDGTRVFMEGYGSPNVYVADPHTHRIVRKIGPFSNNVRPFTITGDAKHLYATVNNFLGFEIADVTTGAVIARVPVEGYGWDRSRILLHNMPNHGIALSPDEKEVWVADGVNGYLHVFDNTVMPPKQLTSIKSRSHPYWITFGFDGQYVYPSTGEVIDASAKRIVAQLKDEFGQPVESEKLVEVMFADGKLVKAVDQFGVGQVRR
jgi:DNA-binding beta-propeller fold protein YncE